MGTWRASLEESTFVFTRDATERALREGVAYSKVEGSCSLQKRQSQPSCSLVQL